MNNLVTELLALANLADMLPLSEGVNMAAMRMLTPPHSLAMKIVENPTVLKGLSECLGTLARIRVSHSTHPSVSWMINASNRGTVQNCAAELKKLVTDPLIQKALAERVLPIVGGSSYHGIMQLTDLQQSAIEQYAAAIGQEPGEIEIQFADPAGGIGAAVRGIVTRLAVGVSLEPPHPAHFYTVLAIGILETAETVLAAIPKYPKDKNLQKQIAATIADLQARLQSAASGQIAELSLRKNHLYDQRPDFAAIKEACGSSLHQLASELDAYEILNGKNPGQNPSEGISCSDDFCTVIWGETTFHFDIGNQAKSVGVLYDHYKRGGLSVHEATIGSKIGSGATSFRLLHVFRESKGKGHPAWGTMIVKGETKGTFFLKNPTITE